MTTELSSSKYFTPELSQSLGLNDQEGDVQVAVTGQPIADPSQPIVDPSQALRPVRKATPLFVTIIACFLALAGFMGISGGVIGAIGQAAITNIDATQLSKTLKSPGNSQVEAYRRGVETRKKFSLVIYLHNGICVLVGLGFIASCFLLMSRRPDANSFASTACIAAICYNCLTVVVTWVTLPSFEGMSGMPPGAANLAVAIAVGFAAFFALIKIGFYGFLISYLSRSHIKAIYEPKTPEASVA